LYVKCSTAASSDVSSLCVLHKHQPQPSAS
jgi:hypothetical protein